MLRKIQPDEFEQFHELLELNFPKNERRTKSSQKKLLELDCYTIYIEKEKNDIVGFFAEWSNNEFRFIEHLAVNENYRGKGTGSRLLKEYHELNNLPVILEVEPPEDNIQKRRVSFYERSGYNLTSFGYIQPPLYEGEGTIPLVLMSYPNMLDESQYKRFKAWAHETVYHPKNK